MPTRPGGTGTWIVYCGLAEDVTIGATNQKAKRGEAVEVPNDLAIALVAGGDFSLAPAEEEEAPAAPGPEEG